MQVWNENSDVIQVNKKKKTELSVTYDFKMLFFKDAAFLVASASFIKCNSKILK